MHRNVDFKDIKYEKGWQKLKNNKEEAGLDEWVYNKMLFENDNFVAIYDNSLIKSNTEKHVVFKKKHPICFKELGAVFIPFDDPDYDSKKYKYFPAVSMMIDNQDNVRRLMFWYDGEYSFSLGTDLDNDEIPNYIRDKIIKEEI